MFLGGSLRLFVICESDSKHRTSTLVSFLHRYKRQPPIFDFDRLRSLVRLKLAVEKSEDSKVTPAAYADHERYTVASDISLNMGSTYLYVFFFNKQNILIL
jgi:hypothetical protein